MELKVEITGTKKALKTLGATELHQIRSLNTAFRIEGFRLKNKLEAQIIAGNPGGGAFAPLSILARRWWSKRENNPIRHLSKGIRYHVPNNPTPTLQVGFVGPVTKSAHDKMVMSGLKLSSRGGHRGVSVGGMTSKSWRRLGFKHQQGFKRTITKPQRRALFQRAASMHKDNPARRVFIIRKDTTEFVTPRRLIIEPFWDSEKSRAARSIKTNWQKKMRGIRI
jgi:hypothetical protein